MKYSVPTVPIAELDVADGELNCVRFSPCGKLFGSAGVDRKVRLWELNNGTFQLKSMLVGCNASVNAIDFDPESTVALGASSDVSCRIWTLNDSRLRVNLTGHSDSVVSAKFIRSASSAVTVSADRTLKLWDVDKCSCKRTIMSMSGIYDVVACPSANSIITGHFDGIVRVWDERTGKIASQISLSGRITGMDIAADSTQVVACTRKDTLEVISLRTNQVVQCFQNHHFQTRCNKVQPCFSPSHQYVAVGSNDGSILVWDTLTSKLETRLNKHSNSVICCHWSPDGGHLVSCERTRRVIVWSS